MVPSKVHPELLTKPIHQRTLQIARTLLGGDMELDFDMLINKAPHSNTITPWHQDTAYWIDMPDKRALSCWIAIDRPQKKTVVCGTRQNRIWNLHVLMSKPEIKARLGVVEMKQSRFMWS
jgi:ectoine hydroxylase-related dioxygenase (phytanoyl-CoA dioxygenase family)